MLILSLLQGEWFEAALLVLLIFWMLTCAGKDHTIWTLTKNKKDLAQGDNNGP